MNSQSSMNEKFELKRPTQKTPEGYFEKLNEKLYEIPGKYPAQVKVIRFRPWAWSSVAAVFLFGSLLLPSFEKQKTEQLLTDHQLEMMALQMSDYLIYEYYSELVPSESSSTEALELLIESGIDEDDFYNY
jgi:hypothetical protein